MWSKKNRRKLFDRKKSRSKNNFWKTHFLPIFQRIFYSYLTQIRESGLIEKINAYMDSFEEKRCQSSQKRVYVKVLITYAILDTQFFILLRLSSEIWWPELGTDDFIFFLVFFLVFPEIREDSGDFGGSRILIFWWFLMIFRVFSCFFKGTKFWRISPKESCFLPKRLF